MKGHRHNHIHRRKGVSGTGGLFIRNSESSFRRTMAAKQRGRCQTASQQTREIFPHSEIPMIFQRSGDATIIPRIKEEGSGETEGLVQSCPGLRASHFVLPVQKGLDAFIEAHGHGVAADIPVPCLRQVRKAFHADAVFFQDQFPAAHHAHAGQSQVRNRTKSVTKAQPPDPFIYLPIHLLRNGAG